MNTTKLAVALLLLALAACAQPKPNINTVGRDQLCVRECSHAYSACASGAGQTFGNRLIAGDVIVACNNGLEICVSTCPAI